MLLISCFEKIVNYEEVNFILGEIMKEFKYSFKSLNINVISDEELNLINSEFLNHYDLTDIITFQNTKEKIIDGELYISIGRVKENAILFGVTVREELLRVIIHGILHICGEDDATDYQKNQMRAKENQFLSKMCFT